MDDIELTSPTDEEIATWPKSVIILPGDSFKDERGEIIPLVDLTMRSAVWISSKKGSVRANHYHKTDWHFCYVVSGSIEYYYRDHGSGEEPTKIVVEPGQMVFTPPMVDHAMVFPEDTEFLTLGRNSRRQEVYEADVERIDPIHDHTE